MYLRGRKSHLFTISILSIAPVSRIADSGLDLSVMYLSSTCHTPLLCSRNALTLALSTRGALHAAPRRDCSNVVGEALTYLVCLFRARDPNGWAFGTRKTDLHRRNPHGWSARPDMHPVYMHVSERCLRRSSVRYRGPGVIP